MTDDLHISADELRMALANHGARQTNASWQALAIACGRAAAAIDALRSQNPAIKRMACDQCKARNEMCDECFETWREQHLDALRSPPADVGEAKWESPWGWWAGRNEEWMTVGPCSTRQEAIDEMVFDGSAESYDEPGLHHLHIVEARQDPLRLADWIGTDWILERADEALAESDRVSCENDDGPWFEATKGQEKDLQDRLRRACDEWQAAHGLTFHSTTFSHMRNAETVSVSAIAETTKGDESATDVGENSSCRRCGKKMERGLAIEQTFVGGIKDFASDTAPVTLSAVGPGRLVDCWKCPGCGHSFALAETTKGDE